MRKVHQSLLSVAVIATFSVFSLGAPALPITTPAVIEPAGPARPAPVSVLIEPFRPIGETTKDAWISDAINEQMTSDLARNPAVHVLHAPTTAPSSDNLDLARQQHADRLVTGSFQTIDDQIRVNGAVIDPADGKTVAQLKVTGAKRDLFRLEDSLVAELEHVLPGVEQPDNSYTVTPVESDGLSQSPEVAQMDNGESSSPGQVVNNYYYDTGTGYGSGYAPYDGYGGYGDYGYPYYGSPFFLYLGGDRYHHFHDGHGFDGHGGYDRQIGGGPIVPFGTVGNAGPAIASPSRGFGGFRGGGPVGGGAMGGGMHGGGGGGHR